MNSLKIYLEESLGLKNFKNDLVEIFKNPKSLRNFPNWARAILTKDGDLYVLHQEGNEVIIHSDIVNILNNKYNIFVSYYKELENPLDYIDEIITLDRSGDSNIFMLAESYDLDEVNESRDLFEPYEEQFKIKHPNFKLIIDGDDE